MTFATLSAVRSLALVCAVAVSTLTLHATAAHAQDQTGPVILTVSGELSNPNRGAYDPAIDKFFGYSELEFANATEFDFAALQALSTVKIKADFPAGGKVQEFEGPLLADVLVAAGAQGQTLSLTALDGYTIEVSTVDLIDKGAVLALNRNGKPLGIGNFGPTQIVFPRAERADLKEMNDDNWIWSVYHIAVK